MSGHTYTHTHTRTYSLCACAPRVNYYKLFVALKLTRLIMIIILYLCKIAHALRVSKHVTESIRNIARGVGIN